METAVLESRNCRNNFFSITKKQQIPYSVSFLQLRSNMETNEYGIFCKSYQNLFPNIYIYMHAMQTKNYNKLTTDLFAQEIFFSTMSTFGKFVKNPWGSHTKSKYDPELGKYYCPCDYHQEKQKAKREEQRKRGVKHAVNQFDRDAYVNRETYQPIYGSNYSSQSHHHSSQEPETFSAWRPEAPQPPPAPWFYSTWKPEAEQGQEPGHRQEGNASNSSWRYGVDSYGDRSEWEANSTKEFHEFMGWK